GLSVYLSYLTHEGQYKSQSILFGNPVAGHLAVLGKFLFYLLITSATSVVIALLGAMVSWEDSKAPYRKAKQSSSGRLTLILTLPALLFYALIYFMKAGYILTVLPQIVLASAIILDQI